MDLLLLGGNSAHNKQWVYEVCDALGPLFDRCLVHEYNHWHNGESFINFSEELTALQAETAGMSDYLIFAKSVGVVLAAQGIERGVLVPHGCLFAGVPLGLVEKQAYPLCDWLACGKQQLVFAQNEADPAGSFDSLQHYLADSELDKYEIVRLNGDTHNYEDMDMLRQLADVLLRAVAGR